MSADMLTQPTYKSNKSSSTAAYTTETVILFITCIQWKKTCQKRVAGKNGWHWELFLLQEVERIDKKKKLILLPQLVTAPKENCISTAGWSISHFYYYTCRDYYQYCVSRVITGTACIATVRITFNINCNPKTKIKTVIR